MQFLVVFNIDSCVHIVDKIESLLSGNGDRTLRAFSNIFAMLFLKGGNIIIGLLLVPMTINYVDAETYGIWLTISSMVAWVSFFDIGINNGLKNKLTESLAKGDVSKGKAYVSTTYALLSLIFLPLMVILLVIVPMVDWQSVLNVSNISMQTLVCAIAIVVAYFCINFIFSTINIVLLADQRPADESLRVFLQQLLTLCVIFIMTRLVPGSLVNLCIALCLCPLAMIVIFNFTLFAGRYKEIAPTIKAVDFHLLPDLLKLGVQFFIIQIAGIIQYQMINFLILHYFGAGDVTAYNIAYKYFNIPFMVWGILTIPIWAAVTDAVTKEDYTWIRSTVNKYLKVFLLFVAGSVVMLAVSPCFYHIWVGESVSVAFQISFWVMTYNLVFMFGTIFVSVLNGASILKVQTIASIISPVLFIGAALLMIKNDFGVQSILIASILANFNGLILAPVQYRHFIKSRLN